MFAKSDGAVSQFHWLCQAISPRVEAVQLIAGLPATEADLAALFRLASHHMVLPGLHLALQKKGLADRFAPEFRDALEGFYQLNVLRNARLRQQMIDVTRLMNDLGVVPIWLKGATHLLSQSWQSAARMMMDLDFWLPDATQHMAVMRSLAAQGYQVSAAYVGLNYDDHHHFLPVSCAGQPASLELHRHIVDAAYGGLLDDAPALNRVQWLTWQGLAIGQLSAPDQLMQSYIQCTEMNPRGMVRGHISLMKALDFVERIEAVDGVYPADFLAPLHPLPWQHNARRFLSFLERDFGLPSPLPPDDSFRQKQERAIKHPHAVYAWFIVAHAFEVLASGRAGSPRDWWPKLAKHLRTLRKSSLPN